MSGHIEKQFIDQVIETLSTYPNVIVITEKSKLPKVFKAETFAYEPDIVVFKNGKITHIIEVETDPVRKALVGGACTCAYFVKKNFSNQKPKLYFAIGELGCKYLENFQARNLVINEFFGNIFSDVQINSLQKILELLKKDLSV